MKSTNERSFELKGVNRTLYDWAMGSKIIQKCIQNEQGNIELLFDIFSANEEKRNSASEKMYQLIWSSFPEFGPNLLIGVLADFEHDRVFYKEYRNHTSHMIKVFFLGIYFYEMVKSIHDNIDKAVKGEENFVKVWVLAALYHDIGYLFENDKIADYKNEWDEFRKEMNKMLKLPMHYVFSDKGASKEKENTFVKQHKLYRESLDSIAEIDNKDNSAWNILSEAGKTTKLVSGADGNTNGIQIYYNIVERQAGGTKRRTGYKDHGICSALILGKVWESYCEVTRQLAACEMNPITFMDVDEEFFDDLIKKEKNTEDLVHIAMNAVALHNIDKSGLNIAEANGYGIYLDNFIIDIKKLPIAALLRICDEIQMWDREKYRALDLDERTLFANDLDVWAKGDAIYICFEDDKQYTDPVGNSKSMYNNLLDKLRPYIGNAIEDLLKYDEKKPEPSYDMDKLTDNDDMIDGMEVLPKGDRQEEEKKPDRWLLGAVNQDEDIHFSALYLGQSLKNNLPEEFKKFGYEEIVAVYENFNERYYIREKECIKVANDLISTLTNDLDFWDNLSNKIKETMEELGQVFSDEKCEKFEEMTDTQILTYYRKHYEAHKQLYTYARIPETLDRGIPSFTLFLKQYLKDKDKELNDEKKLNEVFEWLTYPENINYTGREIIDVNEISENIIKTSSEEEQKMWKSSTGRFLMYLKPDVVGIIDRYINTWKYWGYHGYRNRAVMDLSQMIERLMKEYDDNTIKQRQNMLVERQHQVMAKRVKLFSLYDINERYQRLFLIYSQMGSLKMKRRYYQLRNFYFLDKLIQEIAIRNNVEEGVIRCMLPNEVMALLNGEKDVLQRGRERLASEIFVYQLGKNGENIIYGEEAIALAQKMKKETSIKDIVEGELIGETASLGEYKGYCWMLNQDNKKEFQKGEILVATDLDPDKFELLKMAGAVITETGGFTCHAAIVCRELHIPCVVGVHGLIDKVCSGQKIFVDADHGKIQILYQTNDGIIRTHDKDIIDEEEMGKKAYSLFRLKEAGFEVPDFFCIKIEQLKDIMIQGNDSNMQKRQSFIAGIQDALEELNSDWLAIRSSTNREDGEVISGAGQEITMLRVHRSDVMQDLINVSKALNDYTGKGCIIIQKMILGSYSGVIFTDNPVKNQNELAIQVVPGGNEYLTSGKVIPATFIYDKGKKEFSKTKGVWENILTMEQCERLKDKAMEISAFFNAPQDIEWTMQENKIFILQSRNITGGKKIASNAIFSANKTLNIDTISIYQAYALPKHLRDHMLRTAALVCWLLDRWKGKDTLDRGKMIKACLLHDIGNIVKGTDEKFRMIFPDSFSEDSWQYWLNVRKHIGKRYGTTDIDATLKIASEINVDADVIKLIQEKQFSNNVKTCSESNFEVKICAYADQRISPEGVLSIRDRLSEAKKRQKGIDSSSVNKPNFEELKACALKIEEQIFAYTHGKPEDITDASIDEYIDEMKRFRF